MSLYRNILKQAIAVSWKNKYLWFFGLFAALFIDNSGFELFLQASSGQPSGFIESWNQFTQTGIFSLQGIANAGTAFINDPVTVVFALIFFLLLMALLVFLIWLAVVSQVAIVNNSASITANKKTDFKDGVMAGASNFWPALGLNVLIFLVMVLPILGEVLSLDNFINKALYLIIFIVSLVLILALSFIIKFAIAYLVIKKKDFGESLRSGWYLFKENWLISIEMSIILFAITLVAFLGIKFVLIPLLSVVVLFLAVLIYGILSFSTGLALFFFWTIYILGLALSLLIIVLFGAFISTFQISSWTKLFIELVGKGGQSKIMRIVESMKK